jgi:ribosome-associated protein
VFSLVIRLFFVNSSILNVLLLQSKENQMRGKEKNIKSDQLLKFIIEGIHEKKGEKIVSMKMAKIKNAICSYFIVCQGNSRTQVEAIAWGVQELVRKKAGEKPWHAEGYDNAEWILIDYVDVVLHVFQPHIREHYKLEDLWSDAELEHHDFVEQANLNTL